jgi:hypothetical protein
MKQVDEIIYDAICADADLMEAIDSRVVSTCFEVSPEEVDKTPVPYIIVTDDGFQNQVESKDDLWESDVDRVQASVEITADEPREVQRLVKMVRRAVCRHIEEMYDNGEDIPELESLASSDLAWDWMKPCYFIRLTYSCNVTTEES